MKDTLADIRAKLREGAYENEEQVRLSLVARLLQQLGWDIWNPAEVYTEYVATPSEDKTKVDVALFQQRHLPSVFIEVKAVGRIGNPRELADTERQLRDYNKNVLALFSVITDGRTWRFYHSQTGGEFSKKCFKELDVDRDNLDDLQRAFNAFLSKPEIVSGAARQEAECLLRLSQKQRLMQECLSEAGRLTQMLPFPRLPDALVGLVKQQGGDVTVEEAEQHIAGAKNRTRSEEPPPPPGRQTTSHASTGEQSVQGQQIDPAHPPDLRFTSIIEGHFGNHSANNWNALVCAGIRLALGEGLGVPELSECCGAKVVAGRKTDGGYHPIPQTNVSYQYVPANYAWAIALQLARRLRVPVFVRFRWAQREEAAHPGEEDVLQWGA